MHTRYSPAISVANKLVSDVCMSCCRQQRAAAAAGGSDKGAAPASGQSASATSKPLLTVTYGSQTGTAQEIARNIAAEAGEKGYAAKVSQTFVARLLDRILSNIKMKTMLASMVLQRDAEQRRSLSAAFGCLPRMLLAHQMLLGW